MIAPLRRRAPGRRRLPAADRARARRRGRARAPARAVRGQGRDRARGAHLVVVFGERGRLPNDELRRAGVGAARRDARADRSPRTSSSACGSRPARPAWGKELDDSILPAEAGLDETHVSFTKGCYPGQEPIARLHYRGKVNRRLRVLEVEGERPGRRDPARREGRRPRDERRPRPRARLRARRGAGRRRARARRRKSTATLGHSRARSSGDRALPCGGRGRKFESCRAQLAARTRRRKALNFLWP